MQNQKVPDQKGSYVDQKDSKETKEPIEARVAKLETKMSQLEYGNPQLFMSVEDIAANEKAKKDAEKAARKDEREANKAADETGEDAEEESKSDLKQKREKEEELGLHGDNDPKKAGLAPKDEASPPQKPSLPAASLR